jgi:hypothetical protein
MAQPKKKSSAVAVAAAPAAWPFGRKNYILFAVALAVIVLGFFLLSQNDITFAPLLLVVGYCVLVPWAIIAKDPAKTATPVETPTEPVE